jgi:DNA-directed RNA polymerase subunit K/omega
MASRKPNIFELVGASARTAYAIRQGYKPSVKDLEVIGVDPERVTKLGH